MTIYIFIYLFGKYKPFNKLNNVQLGSHNRLPNHPLFCSNDQLTVHYHLHTVFKKIVLPLSFELMCTISVIYVKKKIPIKKKLENKGQKSIFASPVKATGYCFINGILKRLCVSIDCGVCL